jgi:hypothetical protein
VHLQLVNTECVKLEDLKAIKFRRMWDLNDFGTRFPQYTVEKYAVVLPGTTAVDTGSWQSWAAAGGKLPMKVGWNVWLQVKKKPGKPCNYTVPAQHAVAKLRVCGVCMCHFTIKK